MWDENVLGSSNPQQLIDTLLYLLGVQFALRAKDEHKALQMGIGYDAQSGEKFLEYRESQSKNHQGGLCDFCKPPKVVQAYENKEDPSKCVVNLYEHYAPPVRNALQISICILLQE